MIEGQSIGVALTSQGFNGVDGILGFVAFLLQECKLTSSIFLLLHRIGPVDLTAGTVLPSRSEVPTVTDNLFSQGTIAQNVVSVSFEPTTSDSDTNGELTFGGIDTAKFTGDIVYTPITSTSPASNYWGIDQSITYGSTSILGTTAGIVDTGTTLIMIATGVSADHAHCNSITCSPHLFHADAFQKYMAATGAVPDQNTGLLMITPDQYAALENLYFTVGDATFELSPNAQIWPRALNTNIGGVAGNIYLVVADVRINLPLRLPISPRAMIDGFFLRLVPQADKGSISSMGTLSLSDSTVSMIRRLNGSAWPPLRSPMSTPTSRIYFERDLHFRVIILHLHLQSYGTTPAE